MQFKKNEIWNRMWQRALSIIIRDVKEEHYEILDII